MSVIVSPDKISKIDNGNTLFYRDDVLLKAMPDDSLVVLGENNYTIEVTNLQDDAFIFNIEDVTTLDYHGVVTSITPANLKNVQGLKANQDVIFKELTDKYFGRGGDSIPVSDLRENVAHAVITNWTLDSGVTYYYDFVHNLGSQDLFWTPLDLTTNEVVRVQEIEYLSQVSARIKVKGNTHKLRISVNSGLVGVVKTDRVAIDAFADTEVAISNFVTVYPDTTDITIDLPTLPRGIGFIDIQNSGSKTVYVDVNGNTVNGSSSTIPLDADENLTLFYNGKEFKIQ